MAKMNLTISVAAFAMAAGMSTAGMAQACDHGCGSNPVIIKDPTPTTPVTTPVNNNNTNTNTQGQHQGQQQHQQQQQGQQQVAIGKGGNSTIKDSGNLTIGQGALSPTSTSTSTSGVKIGNVGSTSSVGNVTAGGATIEKGAITNDVKGATIEKGAVEVANDVKANAVVEKGAVQNDVKGGDAKVEEGAVQNDIRYSTTYKAAASSAYSNANAYSPCSVAVGVGAQVLTAGGSVSVAVPKESCLEKREQAEYRLEMMKTGNPDAMAISVTAQATKDPSLNAALNADTVSLANRFRAPAQPVQPAPVAQVILNSDGQPVTNDNGQYAALATCKTKATYDQVSHTWKCGLDK